MSDMSLVQTVSQLTAAMKFLVERQYRFIAVQGEISNLRLPASGHRYFTVKDESAQLKAVLLKPQARYLSGPLRDGDQVICRGRITIYEPRGDYQMLVDTVEAAGDGAWRRRFELLKQKLAAEGLFAEERKRPIPVYPEKIVVVTSTSGAALHDFLAIKRERQANAHVLIYPVSVQGAAAARQLSEAIDRINAEIGGDALVLCRGGGSLEDLSAFNEEIVARAIARSRIPVVTGVGHEIDFTIADFCADRRAPTPTGAAELLFADCRELRIILAQKHRAMIAHMRRVLAHGGQRLLQASRPLSPEHRLREAWLKLALSEERLRRAMTDRLGADSRLLLALEARLRLASPQARLQRQGQRLQHAAGRLATIVRDFPQNHMDKLARQTALLHSHSPLATLQRGYAIVRKTTPEAALIRDSHEAEAHEELEILLRRGSLRARVTERRDDPAW
ncbi:MAG: exodeoxyribonuclease VII large subunit [Desulfobulbaceae bacterium]|jgi:exodeoxyribonuclease VII large subunit|nr:exodeoxyribonuclease VII large subunit [Desulfobulbaceae bacterium]